MACAAAAQGLRPQSASEALGRASPRASTARPRSAPLPAVETDEGEELRFDLEGVTASVVELFQRGRGRDALELAVGFANAAREALGRTHPTHINALATVAALAEHLGDASEAQALLVEAEELHEEFEMEVVGDLFEARMDDMLSESGEDAHSQVNDPVAAESLSPRQPVLPEGGGPPGGRRKGGQLEPDRAGAFLTGGGVDDSGEDSSGIGSEAGASDSELDIDGSDGDVEGDWGQWDGEDEDDTEEDDDGEAKAVTALTWEVNSLVAAGESDKAARLLCEAEHMMLAGVGYNLQKVSAVTRAALHTLWASVLDSVGESDKARALYDEALFCLQEDCLPAQDPGPPHSSGCSTPSHAASSHSEEEHERSALQTPPSSEPEGGEGSEGVGETGHTDEREPAQPSCDTPPHDPQLASPPPPHDSLLASPAASSPPPASEDSEVPPAPWWSAVEAPIEEAAASSPPPASEDSEVPPAPWWPAVEAPVGQSAADGSVEKAPLSPSATIADGASHADGGAGGKHPEQEPDGGRRVVMPSPPKSAASGKAVRPRRTVAASGRTAAEAAAVKSASSSGAAVSAPAPKRAGGGFAIAVPKPAAATKRPRGGKRAAVKSTPDGSGVEASICRHEGNLEDFERPTPVADVEEEVVSPPKTVEEQKRELTAAMTSADHFLGLFDFNGAASMLERQLCRLAEEGAPLRHSGVHVQALVKYGGILWWAGDVESALDAFHAADEILAQRPDCEAPPIRRRRADVWAQLAQVYRASGDLEAADEKLSAAVACLAELHAMEVTAAASRDAASRLADIAKAVEAPELAGVGAGIAAIAPPEGAAADSWEGTPPPVEDALRDAQASLGQVCVQMRDYRRAESFYLAAFADDDGVEEAPSSFPAGTLASGGSSGESDDGET